MRKTRILVVDDELGVIKFVRAALTANDYEVLTALNGAEALQTFETKPPDLVILDIIMPKLDGFEVCRRLREWSQVPIIILSARSDESDIVKGLGLGADDYMSKPFGPSELIARVKAVLRRTQVVGTIQTQPSFNNDGLEINFIERRVTAGGHVVKLTPTEYNLLQELALNSNKVLTHKMLLHKIWGPEYEDEKEYLHVFIGRLRKNLEPDPQNPRYITTISGVGYQFSSTR